MQIVAMAETLIYINADETSDDYWLCVLAQEWAQLCIFLYIRWTCRSQEFSSNFSVMPNLKSKGESMIPPIYRIEMDAAAFKDFSSHEWGIGLPTSSPPHAESSADSFIVMVQNPHAFKATTGSSNSPSLAARTTTTSTKIWIMVYFHETEIWKNYSRTKLIHLLLSKNITVKEALQQKIFYDGRRSNFKFRSYFIHPISCYSYLKARSGHRVMAFTPLG
ncbi:uncharacterized protein LOC122656339 isoform X2 [Telopea speciosissima]|uniref:uncharacterized protein LOC122656339 isoform X2 n=1 Tax=Telopea speciosissima TaxID=54955 RepID=UPI001CC4BBB8|nr:uncharacterized protein LOC122656339 isoform X2 [Telopea speciosissima]